MEYAVLDVFTDTPLEGNPLAVVPQADGLSAETMQRIAREFNLSETVFILQPEEDRSTARIRIFTPQFEMPFAGHPTVGTACWLALKGGAGDKVVLHENVGLVSCDVSLATDMSAYARFRVPQEAAETGVGPDVEAAAKALGLQAADVGFDDHLPCRMSAGAEFSYVPVNNRDAIESAQFDLGSWDAAFGSSETIGAFLYCRETNDPVRNYHARMFAPKAGVPEDPATGSAAAAFAGVIMKFDRPAAGNHSFLIEQGFEMKRPSVIALEMEVETETLVSAHIGGKAVIVAEGTLHL